MARKDYYLILGVPREASKRRIQQAYRRLAKEHHPDRAGSEGKAQFQEIAEAYEVLSDPEKRRDYDDSRSVRAAARRPPAWRAAAPPQRRRHVEPLVPEPLAGPGPRVEELFSAGRGARVVAEPLPRRELYDLLVWMRFGGG